MLLERFLALDLETTGSAPESDGIIEIGAVLFEKGREVQVRSWLTNPGRPIPLRFQQLTGISEAMVQGKPPAEAVLPDLLAMAAGVPVFAHNAAFDAAFLHAACRRAGLEPPGSFLDTVELARIAFPLAKSYRLGSLAQWLNLPLNSAHRAEDDARAAGLLAVRAMDKLATMELDALEEILRLAPGDWSLRSLLQKAITAARQEGRRARPRTAWIRPDDRGLHGGGEEAEPPRELQAIDPEEVAGILGPGGAIAQAHPGYEHRQGQLEMAAAVAEALNGGRHLLLEAGTGTGKSLAYLVPALLWARRNRQRVVVSTHTITLQEQLWEKEIPFLLQALGWDDIKVALAKGRSNYVCLRRWEEAVVGADFGTGVEERTFLMKTLPWLAETGTGDRAELQVAGGQEEHWRQIQSEGEACLGPRCKWFQRHCFAFRARKRAREAELLVVNHALLFADLKAGGGVLPPYDHLIIDEAHHLEQVATEHLGLSLSRRELNAALQRLFRGYRSQHGPGLLPAIKRRLGRPLAARPPLGEPGEELIDKVIEQVVAARERADELFAALSSLVFRMGSGEGEGAGTLRLVPAVRQGLAWEAVETARENLVRTLQRLVEGLVLLGQALDELDDPEAGGLEGTLVEVSRQAGWLQQALRDVDEVLRGEDEASVRWVEAGTGRSGEPWVTLRSAPVSVAEVLRKELFDPVRSVVMTSATLTVSGSFEHLRRSLGLQGLGPGRVRSRVVPSPFQYREQALVLVAEDVPSPKEPPQRYIQGVTEFLGNLLVPVGGRTLVLFTSHRMLRQVYNSLKEPMEGQGLLLLAQGLDGSRGRLVEEFRTGQQAVLFGTASFWEGVDIPGEELSCVVVVRLPFSPPDEPVTAARTEALERRGLSPFFHLSLPQAVIRFKQGFGRLIRSRSDRGVVIILDSRANPRQTRYGSRFLQSLPGPQVVMAPQAEVIRRAAAFLGQGPSPRREPH